MEMDCSTSSPYELVFEALCTIPISHYLLGLSLTLLVFLYNFMEIHFLHDFLTGFRGERVLLTFSPGSELYRLVASKCRTLHGRYLGTPWLASPHLQTLFLHLQSVFPQLLWRLSYLSYKRELFSTPDGGTIALDWLMSSSVMDGDSISKDEKNPIVIVIPGLTSDSDAAYIKHLVAKIGNHGWNVVVSNHRGLGGLSVTSDCFYNAGWTEDIRKVVNTLHFQHPESPLYVVGTSIGANVLVYKFSRSNILEKKGVMFLLLGLQLSAVPGTYCYVTGSSIAISCRNAMTRLWYSAYRAMQSLYLLW